MRGFSNGIQIVWNPEIWMTRIICLKQMKSQLLVGITTQETIFSKILNASTIPNDFDLQNWKVNKYKRFTFL